MLRVSHVLMWQRMEEDIAGNRLGLGAFHCVTWVSMGIPDPNFIGESTGA